MSRATSAIASTPVPVRPETRQVWDALRAAGEEPSVRTVYAQVGGAYHRVVEECRVLRDQHQGTQRRATQTAQPDAFQSAWDTFVTALQPDTIFYNNMLFWAKTVERGGGQYGPLRTLIAALRQNNRHKHSLGNSCGYYSRRTVTMPGGGSKPGERRGGRQKGTPNKSSGEIRAVARRIVQDPTYQANILQRAITGALPPAVECMLFYYAFGKPCATLHHADVDGNSLGVPAATILAEALARAYGPRG